jgi:hypothetical protein
MRATAAVVALACLAAGVVRAEPVDVEAPIVSVGLFKNGLAVVRRTMELPGEGTYRLRGIPEVVHGTFWIESDAPLDVLSTTEDVPYEVPVPVALGAEGGLAGRVVSVHLKDAAGTVLEGTVVTPSPGDGADGRDQGSDWVRRNYISLPYTSGSSSYGSGRRSGPLQQIVLDTADGLVYIDPEMVAFCRAEKGPVSSVRKEHILLLTVGEGKGGARTAYVSYLAKGLAWAPSYGIDISDPDVLHISQKAVVRNELEDLRDAEVGLISGFPSVKMIDVVSPLSPGMEWSRFFSQLAQAPYRWQDNVFRGFVGQAGGGGASADVTLTDLGGVALPQEGGPDIHYHSIGKRSLRVGDALGVTTGEGTAPYERVVEWLVPDNRKSNGRYIDDSDRERNPEKYASSAWDALMFRNPLSFPMTTAPAMVVSDGRFLGQRPSFWTDPGQPATVQITKAMSIRTWSTEEEEEGSRMKVDYWWGREYYRVTARGRLSVDNNRSEPVKMVIRRRLSGKLLEADGEPKAKLLASGIYSHNQRNELTWTVDVEPRASLELNYRYMVEVW